MEQTPPTLVTVEIVEEIPFCARLVDTLRALASGWANVAGGFGASPVRRHSIAYEQTQGGMVVTVRMTTSTATREGRLIVADWRKSGLRIVSEEPVS